MGERDVRKFSDRAAGYESDWIGENFHRPVQERVVELSARVLPSATSILDVGCGTGALLRMCVERFPGMSGTGVDPAEGMVAVASSCGGPGLTFLRGSAEALPVPDGAFDLVVSTDSFHNWPDQRAGVAEIARVLRPGGKVVLVDPFALGWLRGWAFLVRKRSRMRTRPEVEKMLGESGLRCETWQTVFGVGRLPFIHAVIAAK